MANTFFNGGISTKSVNLCPACNPRTDLMLHHIQRDFFLELFYKVGKLRAWTNQTHIPF